jgi:hypothetical protein
MTSKVIVALHKKKAYGGMEAWFHLLLQFFLAPPRKGRRKFTLGKAVKAHRGSTGIAVLFL